MLFTNNNIISYEFTNLISKVLWDLIVDNWLIEICNVSMNADAMGEYCKTLIVTMFVIDDNIVISNRVADYDHCVEDNGLIIY